MSARARSPAPRARSSAASGGTGRAATSHEAGEASPRRALGQWVAARFAVRFHVTLILLWTFVIGLLTTKALLWLGVDALVWRLPLAVCAAYLAFLAAVRAWLAYTGLSRHLARRDPAIDGANLPGDLPTLGEGRHTALERGFETSGGGGEFGGGGASSSFGDVTDAAAGAAEKAGGGLAEALGSADEGVVVAVPLAIIVALVIALLAALGLVWSYGPLILVEAALEAALAGGLVRATRRVDDPGWVGGALRASWAPFALVLVAAGAIGLWAQQLAPEARTLREVLLVVWRG